MLSKIKLGPRLISGFVIVALITAIVGIVGLTKMKDIDQVYLPSIVRLQQFQRNMDNIRAAERTLLIQGITDKTKEFQRSRMADSWNKANEERTAYESIPKSKEESILWNQFVSLFNDWKKLDDEKLRLIQSGKNEEALALSTGDWSNAWVEWEEVIDQLITLNRNATDKEFKNSNILVIFASIAGFILAVTLGIWLTISITRPVSQMVDVANKLAEG
ncbi:MAG: MCP four helix bundle domain-containing protein, partial [bacterium]